MPRPMPSSTSLASAWWAANSRDRPAARQAVQGRELRRSRGVLPRHLRFHGGDGPGRRGVAHPSRRHHPESPQPARQHQHPRQGAGHRRRRRRTTCRGASSTIAACTWWTWRASIRWRRTWSSPASSPSCGNTSSGATSAWITSWYSWTSSTSTRPPMARTPMYGRCCSTWPSAGDTSASCSSRRSSSAPRCSAAWWVTRARRCTAGWTWTSWRRRRTPRCRPPSRSSWPRCPKGELMVRHPHFTQPIFVRFPRPAMLSGSRGRGALSARCRAALRRCRGAAAQAARSSRHHRRGSRAGRGPP